MDSLSISQLFEVCKKLKEEKKLEDDIEKFKESRELLTKFYEKNIKAVFVFSSMKVAELKEECKKRGLKVSGKKQELIDRLNESVGIINKGASVMDKKDKLDLLRVEDLKNICKQLAIAHTGAKQELINRIRECKISTKEEIVDKVEPKKKKSKMSKAKVEMYKEKAKSLIERLDKKCRLRAKKVTVKYDPKLNLFLDKRGLIFDSMERIVIGRYKKEKIRALSDKDIEKCKKLKLPFRMPDLIYEEDEPIATKLDDLDLLEDDDPLIEEDIESDEEVEDSDGVDMD